MRAEKWADFTLSNALHRNLDAPVSLFEADWGYSYESVYGPGG